MLAKQLTGCARARTGDLLLFMYSQRQRLLIIVIYLVQRNVCVWYSVSAAKVRAGSVSSWPQVSVFTLFSLPVSLRQFQL